MIDIATVALTAAPVTVPTTGTSFKIFPTALRPNPTKTNSFDKLLPRLADQDWPNNLCKRAIIVNWTGTNKKASENGIGEQPIIAAVNEAA